MSKSVSSRQRTVFAGCSKHPFDVAPRARHESTYGPAPVTITRSLAAPPSLQTGSGSFRPLRAAGYGCPVSVCPWHRGPAGREVAGFGLPRAWGRATIPAVGCTMPNVLGIDLGGKAVGLAIVRPPENRVLWCGTLHLSESINDLYDLRPTLRRARRPRKNKTGCCPRISSASYPTASPPQTPTSPEKPPKSTPFLLALLLLFVPQFRRIFESPVG